MSDLIEQWLEDKYTGDQPDGSRFKDEQGEYHASNVSQCPRKWFWDFTRETEDTWSPYFELGRLFEKIYGRALEWKFGPSRVKQDVGIEIHISDDMVIVGESDWVVFEEDFEYQVEKVILKQDGSREAVRHDGTRGEYQGEIQKVIETKTTKDISWRERYGHKQQHLYQVQTYMWAMDCPGEIAYMTRNELNEMVFEFERSEHIEQDIEIRVRRHDSNLTMNQAPDTDPLTERACEYCEWNDECEELGGSRWR